MDDTTWFSTRVLNVFTYLYTIHEDIAQAGWILVWAGFISIEFYRKICAFRRGFIASDKPLISNVAMTGFSPYGRDDQGDVRVKFGEND